MDVCIKKQLIATTSSDKSVRVWDYERKSLEIIETFSDEGHGIAFHPSGFHIVAGFTDRLRFINLVENKLVVYKELPLKNCKEIKFCNGGQMVAVASGNIIHVFNFYTGECPPHFIFKGQETNITSLHWKVDDTGFYSSNWNGIIERANLSNGASEMIYSLKGTKISCVLEVVGKPSIVYAGTSDRQIRSFRDNTPLAVMDAGATLGNLIVTKGRDYMFAGVEEKQKPGPIRVYKYPLNGDFGEVEAHSSEIKRIRLSYNNKFLFSAGSDGTLFIFEVKRSPKLDDIRIAYSGDILANSKELSGMVKEIEDLREENKEKMEENERIFNEEKQKKLNEIQQRQMILDEQIKIYEEFIRQSEEETETEIRAYNERLQSLIDDFEERKIEEKKNYKQKMKEEDERMIELDKEIKEQTSNHNRIINDAIKRHKEILESLKEKHKEELTKVKDEEKELTQKITKSEKYYVGKRTDLEEKNWKNLDI